MRQSLLSFLDELADLVSVEIYWEPWGRPFLDWDSLLTNAVFIYSSDFLLFGKRCVSRVKK